MKKLLILAALTCACGTDKDEKEPEVWEEEAAEESFGLTFPIPVPPEVPVPPIVVETDCEKDARDIWDSWHDGKHNRKSHGGPGMRVCWPGEKNKGKKDAGRFCIGDDIHSNGRKHK